MGVRRVLVHRVGQLGDLLCAVPVLAALREQENDAWIGLLVSPVRRTESRVLELFDGTSFVDEVITYYRDDLTSPAALVAWVRKLRSFDVDTFVELSSVAASKKRILRDLVLGKIIGARTVIGWTALRQRFESDSKGEVDRLMRLAEDERLLRGGSLARFPLAIPRSIRARSVEVVSDGALRCHIALNPGAKRQTNRWPLERFAAVGRSIALRGMTVVLTGSPRERDLCLRVRDLMGTDAIIAAGEGGVLFTAAVLERCAALVTNDTGTMHLAAAVGTPAVVAGTARDVPGRWHPWGDGHRVIRKDVPCSPCFRETCSHLTCLDQISVTEVLQALEEVLEAWRRGRDAEMSRAGVSQGCR